MNNSTRNDSARYCWGHKHLYSLISEVLIVDYIDIHCPYQITGVSMKINEEKGCKLYIDEFLL